MLLKQLFFTTLGLIAIGVAAEPNFKVGRELAHFDLEDSFEYAEPLYKYDSSSSSEGLSEFTPIRSTITQTELQQYSFSVNTSTGLGEYYELLIFITGNICSEPEDREASANQSLTVYYSFNASMFEDYEQSTMVQFENGYFQALADVPVSSGNDSTLYIGVRAPESTNTSASWSYEIGVSQNDLVYQWDNRSFTQIVDTDSESALIVTGNLSASGSSTEVNTSLSKFQLFIYPYEDYNLFEYLNHSWCAVRNGPALFSTSNYNTSYTTRGGALRQQFYIEGLNASTSYVGYLVSDNSGSKQGGAVYKKFEFDTMSSDACTLIYDLEFCNEVAYSVPASSLDDLADKSALAGVYNDNAKSLYSNFSKALQQIACNTTLDARYSPIRTCDDCASSYKNWLCSVSIPRCSTRNITGYVERDVGQSRNTFIDDTIIPSQSYFEVLPCVNVCHAIARDCPPDFNFQCPSGNDSIRLSYFWDTGSRYGSCNYVGEYASVKSAASRAQVLGWAFPISLVALYFI